MYTFRAPYQFLVRVLDCNLPVKQQDGLQSFLQGRGQRKTSADYMTHFPKKCSMSESELETFKIFAKRELKQQKKNSLYSRMAVYITWDVVVQWG